MFCKLWDVIKILGNVMIINDDNYEVFCNRSSFLDVYVSFKYIILVAGFWWDNGRKMVFFGKVDGFCFLKKKRF